MAPCRLDERVWFVRFSDDGRFLLAGGGEYAQSGVARVWELASGAAVCPPLRFGAPAHSGAFSPDARGDFRARLWDRNLRQSSGFDWGLGGQGYSVGVSADGNQVAVSFDCGRTAVKRIATDEPPRVIEADTSGAAILSLSADGALLAMEFPNDEMRIFKTWSGVLAGAPLKLTFRILCGAFSPDGSTLVLGGEDPGDHSGGRVAAWQTSDGRKLYDLEQEAAVRCMDFHPPGHLFVTGCSDDTFLPRSARVWRTATGKPVGSPMWLTDGISSLAFSHDGRLLALGGDDGSFRVWDTEGCVPVGPRLEFRRGIQAMEFSSDDRLLLTALKEGAVAILDPKRGEFLSPPLRHADVVRWADLSSESNLALGASADGVIRLWELHVAQQSTTDLELLARLYSGNEIADDGHQVALQASQMDALWASLRKRWPQAFQSRTEKVVEWHRLQLQVSRQPGNDHADQFHRKRLADLLTGEENAAGGP